MPIIEFKCPDGHVTEQILPMENDHIKYLICAHPDTLAPQFECNTVARRVEFSQTAPPILIGQGFYKQSVSKNPAANGGLTEKQLSEIETVNP